jgi:hypothetical protein
MWFIPGSVDIVVTANQTDKAFTAEAQRAQRTSEAKASGQSRQKRSGRDLSYSAPQKSGRDTFAVLSAGLSYRTAGMEGQQWR